MRNFWLRRTSAGLYFPLLGEKAIEAEVAIDRDRRALISCEFTTKRDHAGVNFELKLFGMSVYIDLYDGRHWNRKDQRWYRDQEEADLRDRAKLARSHAYE